MATTPVALRRIPGFRDEVAMVPVADEALLYEEESGELHRLDPIARAVCELLDGARSLDAVVTVLAEAYGERREVVESDVVALVDGLWAKGLLVDAGPPRSYSHGD